MKKKYLAGAALILILLTLLAAVIHLSGREPAAEGVVALLRDGKESVLAAEDISLTDIEGTVVNGKGEEKEISARGAYLSDILGRDLVSVTVTADDSYKAEVPAEDLERACLIQDEDGSIRLVVFGDQNAKRNVKNVVRIEVQD